jgi:hypothetical protein
VAAAGTSPPRGDTILIADEGSTYADSAIVEGARMFSGADSVVKTV